MKIKIILLNFFLLAGCSTIRDERPEIPALEISELNPDKKTTLTMQNIKQLTKVYDLQPLLFTKKIQISSTKGPYSHPVLTLNTKYVNKPDMLLSQLLHEQLHWWAALNAKKMHAAILELKKIYPETQDIQGRSGLFGYAHLVICYLEYEVLGHYIGREKAGLILDEFRLKEKLLPWTYYQVLHKNHAIKEIVEKFELLPPPLT